MVYVKLFLAALFWGGTFTAGRILANDLAPFSAAFLRFFIAAMCLLILNHRIEGRFIYPGRSMLFPVILLGMTGVFAYNAFFFMGLKRIAAGRAAMIIALNPIVISLMAAYVYKEKLTIKKYTGVFIALSGAVIAISRGNPVSLLRGGLDIGDFLIFGCVLSWTAYSMVGKGMMNQLSPLATVCYSAVSGAVALFFPACFEGIFGRIAFISWQSWTAIFYLGFFGTVLAFWFYYQGVQQIGLSRASLFINFVPISGILSAFLILDEALSFSLGIGAVFVFFGVYLTHEKTVGS